MSRVFIDTNIIVYQFDASELDKQRTARELLTQTTHDLVVSTQVLLEVFVVISHKLDPPLPHAAASRVVDLLAELPVVATDSVLVQRAVATAGQHQLSVWDAMIVEAAAEAGCLEIWTEDLATGSTIRGVRIVNPFTEPPSSNC